MGTNTGLDADLLDGMQPLELPISDSTQLALDGKYDKTGGIIGGNVSISGTLDVSNETNLTGNVSLSTITTDVTLQRTLTVNDAITGGSTIDAIQFNAGLNTSNRSAITFQDSNASGRPAFYWDNNSSYKDFYVDTDIAVGNVVWHAGNFNPDDKYDVTGGDISGNVGIAGTLSVDNNTDLAGNLSVTGTSILNGNTTANNDLTVGNVLTANAATITNAASIGGELNVGGSAHVSGTGIFGSGLTITGASTFDGTTEFTGTGTFNNALNVSGNISGDAALNISGDITTDQAINVGYDVNNDSSIVFTDLGGRVPQFYWSKDNADFYINVDTSSATGGVVWHAGNLDPTDETVFPKHFDALQDTPNNKTNSAGKYLRVSTDETKIEYVDVPDDSALWGNITGDINNQQDLIDKLNLKYD
jgi:cytoskeletal protein CcmA (bactofilin family)